jgi:hypothetical protein
MLVVCVVCVAQMISVYDTLARGHPGGVVRVC